MSLKKLVIFYSLDGNTKFIAQVIAQEIKTDLLELKPKKDINNKGFMKYLWGGRQVFFKETPELYPLDKNPNDYDLIFIGTPVWSFSYTPALNSFFTFYKLTNKKIALFCCSGGAPRNTIKKYERSINRQ